MAKVTINPVDEQLPSAQIVKDAAAEVTVTDARGRVLTLKKPNFLSQTRFMRVIGDETQGYIGMATMLIYLSAIDGDPVYTPGSIREIEALFQQLDEDGYIALSEGAQANFKRTPEKDKEAIKK
ncbi:MAG: hypothetical protein ACXWAT_00905 [Methylobacter sp.]